MSKPTENSMARSVSIALILVSLGVAAGRIAVVTSPEGDTAFLSANDRSRWATIACLVERGTYQIDRQLEIVNPVYRNRRPWGTIDKVRHVAADGKQHYYSSKPPLFPTMVAGVYKLLHLSTGLTMTRQPVYVPRIMLALVNLPMLAVLLASVVSITHRIGRTDWGRGMAAAGACMGTMLLPFTISLNNHLPAAAATAVTMAIYFHAARRIEGDPGGPVSAWWWFLAGTTAAFAAANELPALSMCGMWGLLFLVLSRRSWLPYLAGVLVVAAAFFGTNWIAHQSLRPPYAHRGNGALIVNLESSEPIDADRTVDEVRQVLRDRLGIENELGYRRSAEAGRYLVDTGGRLFGVLETDGGLELRHWDDWYEYPGSYWQDGNRVGVDLGQPSRWIYFLHMTVGHYGVFSLTPIWVLLPIGFAVFLVIPSSASCPVSPAARRFAGGVLIATLVCVAFYISRPEIDRNYGGVSTCFRWLLWFAPLWLVLIGPAWDRLSASSVGRAAGMILLVVSVFSMSTALSSPWQSPWLYRFWQFLGWLDA